MNPAGPPEWVVVALIGVVAALPLLLALTAVITGMRALRVIRDAAGDLRGRGMAITGILCGAGGLLLGALVAAGIGMAWIASPKSLERKSDTELQVLVAQPGVRRQGAARALASRGAAGRTLLLEILADPARAEAERTAALVALRDAGGVRWRDHLPVLLHIMGGTTFDLQMQVGPLLTWQGGIGPGHVIPFLLDDDPQRRAGAVAAMNTYTTNNGWGAYSPLTESNLPGLIRALEQSGDRQVRLAVVGWLEGMGGRARTARAALQAVADGDPDADVATAAQAALTVLGK